MSLSDEDKKNLEALNRVHKLICKNKPLSTFELYAIIALNNETKKIIDKEPSNDNH